MLKANKKHVNSGDKTKHNQENMQMNSIPKKLMKRRFCPRHGISRIQYYKIISRSQNGLQFFGSTSTRKIKNQISGRRSVIRVDYLIICGSHEHGSMCEENTEKWSTYFRLGPAWCECDQCSERNRNLREKKERKNWYYETVIICVIKYKRSRCHAMLVQCEYAFGWIIYLSRLSRSAFKGAVCRTTAVDSHIHRRGRYGRFSLEVNCIWCLIIFT